MPEAARSKAWVCGRSFVLIASSNPIGGMDVCLLEELFFVRYRCLRRADLSSRGVPSSVVCLNAIEQSHRGGQGPLGLSYRDKKIVYLISPNKTGAIVTYNGKK